MSRRPRHVGTDGRKLDLVVLKRLMAYVFKSYKIHYIFILIGIIISALVSVASSLFLKTLLDDYIGPLIKAPNKDFKPLLNAIFVMSLIYLTGIVSNFIYEKILVIVSQGTLEKISKDINSHMQK